MPDTVPGAAVSVTKWDTPQAMSAWKPRCRCGTGDHPCWGRGLASLGQGASIHRQSRTPYATDLPIGRFLPGVSLDPAADPPKPALSAFASFFADRWQAFETEC